MMGGKLEQILYKDKIQNDISIDGKFCAQKKTSISQI